MGTVVVVVCTLDVVEEVGTRVVVGCHKVVLVVCTLNVVEEVGTRGVEGCDKVVVEDVDVLVAGVVVIVG
jgi:hypothetical protein